MFRHALPTLLLATLALPAIAVQDAPETKTPDPLHPRVKMEIAQGDPATPLGDIILELDAEKAPITVENFLRYAQDGYYTDTVFHRVMSTFMIQGGGFTPAMDKKDEGLRAPIKNEWETGLKNVRGTIAMARQGWQPGMPPEMKIEAANSATSQFFINVVDNARLDQAQADGAAYCAFGKVVEGMDVVDKIKDTDVIKHPKYPGPQAVTPKTPVVIKSVTLLDGLEYAQVAEVTKPAVEAAAKEAADRAAAKAKAQAEAQKEADAVAAKFKDLLAKGEDETGNKLQKTVTGLQYVILAEGTGPSPQFSDEKLRETTTTEWLVQNPGAGPRDLPKMSQVTVHYTGWLMDGTKFDSSRDRNQPATFPLNGVIKGWFEGVSMMKVGGRRLLVIPADLAYGPGGRGPIPPNATLVFDVELLAVR